MFTSRAEYRLTLRADNADQRLTPIGERFGIIGLKRRAAFSEKLERLEAARQLAKELSITPNEAKRAGITVRQDGVRRNAAQLLSLPDVNFSDISRIWPQLENMSPEIVEQLEVDAHYAGYLDRQEADIIAFRKDESLMLPPDFDYDAVVGLSTECRSKLKHVRPNTFWARPPELTG